MGTSNLSDAGKSRNNRDLEMKLYLCGELKTGDKEIAEATGENLISPTRAMTDERERRGWEDKASLTCPPVVPLKPLY